MDPKFLEELQKLKEQKDADLNKMQDLQQLSIPDFEELELPEIEPEPEGTVSGGTIQFEKVTEESMPISTPAPGGRRGRKPEEYKKPAKEKIEDPKRKKIRNTILISAASSLFAVAILLTAFFGIRNANQKNYSYPYLGMGVAIENGVNQYTFFGNLHTITQYGAIGQLQAQAEFKKGNCIKETIYTAEGNVNYYYTHEYDGDFRIGSALYQDGQIVQSVSYAKEKDGKIKATTIYYLEENREEISLLTLSGDGNLTLKETQTDGQILLQQYNGPLVAESTLTENDGTVVSRYVYEYNGNKQLLTQTEYDGNNGIQSRTVNQYNEKNLLTKTIFYNGDGDILNYDTYNYDQNGNPIKQVQYSGNGTMLNQILRVFNDKNRVVKETSLKSDGSIQYCTGYDYDDRGNVFKSIVYDTENSTVIRQYTLLTRNEAGTVIESNTYNAAKTLIEKMLYNHSGFLTNRYQYNDSGNLTLEELLQYDQKQRVTLKSTTNYTDDGKKKNAFSEQYDEMGLVVVQVEENVEESLYIQRLFEYHSDGWRQKETAFDKNGKTLFERQYDQKGRIKSEKLFEKGVQTVSNEYVYDENDRVVTKSSLDSLTSILIKTVYTYDKNGILLSSLDSNVLGVAITKREYDKQGLVTEITNYDDDGFINGYVKFEYDDQSRVIVEKRYDIEKNYVGKTVYYYRVDGGTDYTIYDESDVAVEDSRGSEYLPDNDDSNNDDQNQNTDSTDTNTPSSDVTQDNN